MGMVRLVIHGNLTQDPVLKEVKGVQVLNFTVACNVYQGKDRPEKTHYVRVTAWRAQAESWFKTLRKGTGVIVWGRADLHTWNDTRDGSPRGAFELEAEGLDFAGAKKDADAKSQEMSEADDEELPFGEEEA